MRVVTGVLAVSLTCGAAISADQGRGNAKKGETQAAVVRDTRPGTQISIVFSDHDIRLIRTHYQSQYRSLPPGLQKKLARGGSLPPGWQQKMQPMPVVLERELIVLSGGHRYGVMDGHAVIYHPITHAILDIVSLF
jgi:hypothetical protein